MYMINIYIYIHTYYIYIYIYIYIYNIYIYIHDRTKIASSKLVKRQVFPMRFGVVQIPFHYVQSCVTILILWIYML